MTHVKHQHDATQSLTFAEIVLNHAGPDALLVSWCAREAISGQIDEMPAVTKREKVELARTPGHFAGVGQSCLPGEFVDTARLSGVGAARKGDFWPCIKGQAFNVDNRLVERHPRKFRDALQSLGRGCVRSVGRSIHRRPLRESYNFKL